MYRVDPSMSPYVLMWWAHSKAKTTMARSTASHLPHLHTVSHPPHLMWRRNCPKLPDASPQNPVDPAVNIEHIPDGGEISAHLWGGVTAEEHPTVKLARCDGNSGEIPTCLRVGSPSSEYLFGN